MHVTLYCGYIKINANPQGYSKYIQAKCVVLLLQSRQATNMFLLDFVLRVTECISASPTMQTAKHRVSEFKLHCSIFDIHHDTGYYCNTAFTLEKPQNIQPFHLKITNWYRIAVISIISSHCC